MSASLNNIVDVTVRVSSPISISSDFNLGMIIDNRDDSPAAGKVNIYYLDTYQSQMVSDGFATTDDAYKKAVIYFSQNERSARLAIAGTNASENVDDAFTRIRNLNNAFYCFCFAATVEDTNIAKVAALVEASSIPTMYFFGTSDSKCIQAGTSNILKTVMDGSFTRTFGFYSSDTNIDAGIVGLISGLNSMKANSAYTAAYKTLVGVTPTNIDDSALQILVSYKGNCYNRFGNNYNFTYPCVSGGGYAIDENFLIDAAKYLIQQEAVAGLVALKKVPRTDDGVNTIISFASRACNTLANIGLIAGGIWGGEQVLNLDTGDAIENGYYIEAESVSTLTPSQREQRMSPPIYIALLATGAIEHVVISVVVER